MMCMPFFFFTTTMGKSSAGMSNYTQRGPTKDKYMNHHNQYTSLLRNHPIHPDDLANTD